MAIITRKAQVTQATGFVDVALAGTLDPINAVRLPETWWLQLECCLTSNAGLATPPLVNPSAGSLAVGIKTPGAVGFAPAQFDGGASISLLALPLARASVVIASDMRFTVTGLDADKTLLITLNGEI